MCSYIANFFIDENLQPNTYALSMQLIAIALDKIPFEMKEQFEIMCCACLFVSCKLEEIYVYQYY